MDQEHEKPPEDFQRMDEKRLFFAAAAEVLACPRVVASFDLGVDTALSVLAMLQLALRHPRVATNRTAEKARIFAERLEESIGKLGPALAELARRGWHAEYDSPATPTD